MSRCQFHKRTGTTIGYPHTGQIGRFLPVTFYLRAYTWRGPARHVVEKKKPTVPEETFFRYVAAPFARADGTGHGAPRCRRAAPLENSGPMGH